MPRVAILGKYTFALYLTHLVVLYTFACTVFLVLHERMGYNSSVLLTCALSIPVMGVVTVLFEKYVDAPSILFSKYAVAVCRGERQIEWRKIGARISRRTKSLAEKYIGLSGDPSLSYDRED